MIIYRMDKSLETNGIISDFISLVWTERWRGCGDFQLKIPYSHRYTDIVVGTPIGIAVDKTSVMMVESVENDSNRTLTFKGRSMECLLEAVYFTQQFVLTGTPEGNATDILKYATHYDRYKKTAGKTFDAFMFKPLLWSESSGKTVYASDDTSVLDQLQQVLSVSNSGYRLDKTGSDTSPFLQLILKAQRPNPDITLSTGLGDFESFTILSSINDYRNVAIVKYTLNEVDYYMPVVTPEDSRMYIHSEMKNRSIMVDATSVNRDDFASHQDFMDSLTTKGLIELYSRRFKHAFDGKLTENKRIKFGVNYFLGDVLPVIHDERTYNALVTEYIISYENGKNDAYPTLEFI